MNFYKNSKPTVCIICKSNKINLIWYDKIRVSSKKFSKNNEKIFQCINCELVFLKNKKKYLEDSSIARSVYNKNNTVKEFIKFHKPRELNKLNIIKRYISIDDKDILESNSGAGILLSVLKSKAKSTTGIDSKLYENFLKHNGHRFYNNISDVIKDKKKFDIIFTLSELEHKFNPIIFLKNLKKILKKRGTIILRIPNFNNIYKILIGDSFLKYDYRSSHNYYFGKKNLDILFKKLNFKIEKCIGYNEYDMNHLIEFMKKRKRIYLLPKKIFSNKQNEILIRNIEKNFNSTSLIYFLKRNR